MLPVPWRKAAHYSLRVSVAMVGAVVSATTEGPWSIAGALAAIAVLVLTLAQIGMSARQFFRLKSPCAARFRIGPHRTHTLNLPEHTRVRIEIELVPRVTFSATNMMFKCSDIKSSIISRQPHFDARFTSASISGLGCETSYKRDPTDGAYYILSSQFFAKGIPIVFGFWVITGGSGKYSVLIHFIENNILGNSRKLSISVHHNRPYPKIRCKIHKKCWIAGNATVHE
jgi:hypothetical protein